MRYCMGGMLRLQLSPEGDGAVDAEARFASGGGAVDAEAQFLPNKKSPYSSTV